MTLFDTYEGQIWEISVQADFEALCDASRTEGARAIDVSSPPATFELQMTAFVITHQIALSVLYQ